MDDLGGFVMVKADISARVEPMEGGRVVFLPMAPITSKKGVKARGRLQLRVDFSNNEPLKAVTVETVDISFPGSTAKGGSRAVGVTLPAGPDVLGSTTTVWVFSSPADHVVFDLPAPSSVQLSFTCEGYDEPTSFVYELRPHVAPVPGGAYLFPAKAADLRVGEFWSVNGCTHGAGHEGSQLFAYDMGVMGKDHVNGGWSDLIPGGSRKKNDDLRCWNKPLYAVADGVVLEAVNDCPENPFPLEWKDEADLAAKMAEQKKKYWGAFPNGGSGNHLYVQHGDEVFLYAHLKHGSIPPQLLEPKAKVKAGQQIGVVGNSGNSSGPHLHVHAVQGTAPEVGPLRPLVWRSVWTIDNDLIQSTKPDGFWSKVDRQGIPEGSVQEWWKQDVFLWPSEVPPPWPEAIRLSVAEGEYQDTHDRLAARGFHPVWIDAHDVDVFGTRTTWFNAIYRPMPWPGYVVRLGMDGHQYNDEFSKHVEDGDLSLVHVESYWSGRDKRINYAAIFAAGPKLGGSAYHGVDQVTHEKRYADLVSNKGLAPMSISVVSVNGKRQFTARYEARDAGVVDAEWDMSVSAFQKRFDANDKLSLVYLNFYRHAGEVNVAAIWHQKAARPFVQHHLDKSELDALTKTTRRDGLLLRCVTGYQRGALPNYAAIWAPPPA